MPSSHPSASSKPTTLHILAALLTLLLLLLLCASFPLLVLLSPKPELNAAAYPSGIMCATCEQIAGQNPELLVWRNGGRIWRVLGGIGECDLRESDGLMGKEEEGGCGVWRACGLTVWQGDGEKVIYGGMIKGMIIRRCTGSIGGT